MGASWSPLGASWGPLGGLWGLLGGLFGRLRAFLARLTPSEAVLGASLGRLGALLGRFRSVLETILGVSEASWAVLGPSEAGLGAILGASWAVLERRVAEKARIQKTVKNNRQNQCFFSLGALLGRLLEGFWRVLEASTPLGTILGVFERTVGERGPLWRPLGAENSNFSSGSRVWASSWSRRGAVLGASWVPLGPSWGFLGPSGGRLQNV